MRTTDGGAHWASTRVVPEFRPTGDLCNGGDPAVAYSRRDRAFYMSQLCFFRELGHSEVQVYVSKDDGKTWTPGRQAARAASTYDYATKTEDSSNFNDKEYIAVDNTPTSPHYGRGGSQLGVARDDWRCELFGEGDVGGVVGGEVSAKSPHTIKQRSQRHPPDGQSGEMAQRERRHPFHPVDVPEGLWWINATARRPAQLRRSTP